MDSNFPKKFVSLIASIGVDPNDSEDIRLQKTLLVFSSLMMASLSIVWGSIYLAFGERLAASIPLSYTALSYLSIAFFARTRRYEFFRASQLLFPLLLPFLLMLALGGFVNSSAVVLWSLTSPLGALLFAGRRQAVGWFLAYLALVAIGAFLEPFLRPTNNLPPVMAVIFFVMNIGCTSTVAFVLLQYFVSQKNATLRLLHLEQEKSENLLLKYSA
jgi:guanylate cyclase